MPYKFKKDKNANARVYYMRNLEKLRVNKKRYKFKRRYGISLDELERMKVEQEHKCLGCGLIKPLCVDHCHITGEIRGLLCRQCNAAIGLAQENVQILKNLVRYLEQ